MATSDEMVRRLVERLGGDRGVARLFHEPLEFNEEEVVAEPRLLEEQYGYCYLKIFDEDRQMEALALGSFPKVADLRRFANSRVDVFGTRKVKGTIISFGNSAACHVEFDTTFSGVRPVVLLASLFKDCVVGGIPDGPSSEFPPSWIPAKLEAYQCWDYIPGNGKKALDFLNWVGELHDDYELVSAESSRVRWVVSASPVGPDTSHVDIVPPNGKTLSVNRWESTVAHTGLHQGWQVRGDRVFVEAYVWRAAKITTTPGAPRPTPKPGGGHNELSIPNSGFIMKPVVASGHRMLSGYCYVPALNPCFRTYAHALGPMPDVADLLNLVHSAMSSMKHSACAFLDGFFVVQVKDGLYHIAEGHMSGHQLLGALMALPPGARVGATQAASVTTPGLENTAAPAVLSLRPKVAGTVLSIPFAAKVTPEMPTLYWDLTAGKKLGGLLAYFESAELVSLAIKVTVHKGDGDTLFSMVADTESDPFKNEMDWVGAPHTLHVSGNSQGATSGEMVLEGNHGFGTQLKGAILGNPTPILQGWLQTSVIANVLVKAVLKVRVVGTGNPRAVILLPRRATGSMVNSIDDDESEDGGNNSSGVGAIRAHCNPSGKAAGR